MQGGCNRGKLDLSSPDAAEQLDALKACSPRVKGIRMILTRRCSHGSITIFSCHTLKQTKSFRISRAVHALSTGRMLPTFKGHNTDYLRDPARPRCRARLCAARRRDLSFDLQCCPAQMAAADALLARHPKVPVCIDHLGKPWKLKADGGEEDTAKIGAWREGMTKLAALPQTACKLSMLGLAVPGWPADPKKEALIKELVLEVIALFGAKRCMFNSNWHISTSISNSDAPASIRTHSPWRICAKLRRAAHLEREIVTGLPRASRSSTASEETNDSVDTNKCQERVLRVSLVRTLDELSPPYGSFEFET